MVWPIAICCWWYAQCRRWDKETINFHSELTCRQLWSRATNLCCDTSIAMKRFLRIGNCAGDGRRHSSNRQCARHRSKLDIYATISCRTTPNSAECTANNKRDRSESSSPRPDDTDISDTVALRHCQTYEFARCSSNRRANPVTMCAIYNRPWRLPQIGNCNEAKRETNENQWQREIEIDRDLLCLKKLLFVVFDGLDIAFATIAWPQ